MRQSELKALIATLQTAYKRKYVDIKSHFKSINLSFWMQRGKSKKTWLILMHKQNMKSKESDIFQRYWGYEYLINFPQRYFKKW